MMASRAWGWPLGLRALLAFGVVSGPALAQSIDASTLTGKVMCGYQGWFGSPGDGIPAFYKNGGSVSLGNTSRWKRKIFPVTDAYFGNRQNNRSDFRIARFGGGFFYLDRVLVTSPGAPPPVIELSAAAFERSVERGASLPDEVFTITNAGGDSLTYSVSTDRGWLSVSPTGGTSTGETDAVAVTYAVAGLPVGDHPATIVVTDTGPSGRCATIPVLVHITKPPTPGDFDLDNDVDQADYGRLQGCLSGIGLAHPAECGDADLDRDGDVDAADLQVFLECMGGANQPPPC